MKAKIIRVSRTDTGLPVHCFRPGEIVTIHEFDTIPLNDGKGGKGYSHIEAYCEGSDGTFQGVAMDDLEIIL